MVWSSVCCRKAEIFELPLTLNSKFSKYLLNLHQAPGAISVAQELMSKEFPHSYHADFCAEA